MTKEMAFKKFPPPKLEVEYFAHKCLEWRVDTKQKLKKLIQQLEKEISKPPKKCRVCGAKLELHGMTAGEHTYYCSAVHYIGGSREEQKHFSDSRTVYQYSVYKLGELEAYKKILESLR